MTRQVVEVAVTCYKPNVNLPELVVLIDGILQQQGYEVQAVATRIVEVKDEVEIDSPCK